MTLVALMLSFWLRLNGGPMAANGMTDFILAFILLGSIYAYLGMLIVAFPANLLLSLFNAERGIVYILMGGLGAFIPMAVVTGDWRLANSGFGLFIACAGALTATFWWLIASKGAKRDSSEP